MGYEWQQDSYPELGDRGSSISKSPRINATDSEDNLMGFLKLDLVGAKKQLEIDDIE